MSVYLNNGYSSRDDYLLCLSEEYSIDLNIVKALAELLGPSEDFDGLRYALEDYSGEG